MNTQQIAVVAKNVNFEIIEILQNQYKLPFSIITPHYTGEKLKNISIFKDDFFISRNRFIERCKHSRPGWLYQQFLKYEVVIKSDFENTLIIDGDSVVKSLKFLNPNTIYYTPKNIESFYNNFISKILGDEYVTNKNYITNQMNFNRANLISMIETAFGSLSKYQELIVDHINENKDAEFSEYQTYAAWVRHKHNAKSEMIKVFRRLDLINAKPIESLEKYDLVAFEHGHKTDLLRTIRAKIYYSLGKNLG